MKKLRQKWLRPCRRSPFFCAAVTLAMAVYTFRWGAGTLPRLLYGLCPACRSKQRRGRGGAGPGSVRDCDLLINTPNFSRKRCKMRVSDGKTRLYVRQATAAICCG